MKVYVAFAGDYSGRGVTAVFSDKAKAEECSGDVEEHELDELAASTMRAVYEVRLRMDDGAMAASFVTMSFGPSNFCLSDVVGKFTKSTTLARGQSSTSKEHALKLAAEARQSWLRECSLVMGPGIDRTREALGEKISA